MTYTFILLLLSPFAQAFSIGNLQGDHRQTYRSLNGQQEVCVVPKRWPGGGYYLGNDGEKENTLCSYDFYSNIGVCPKYNSTNPGVLLVKPNDKYNKAAIDASNCNVKAMDVKTEAKFKQSISCSNTSSILAYYQLSRQLGNVGRVPVAVIRTMDFGYHAQLTQKALKHLAGSSDAIADTWSQYQDVHRHPGNYPQVVDSSRSQIYGALSDNPSNEEIYTEISGVGSYNSRYQRFLQQKPFLRVATAQSVRDMLGTGDFVKVVQTVTQMKDVSDMILLDTLLNQQDRIGNIHYKFFWYALDTQNPRQINRIKSGAKWKNGKVDIPKDETAAMSGRTAVLVKEMLLKDNDCGVSKDNMMRKISALEKVRHMSYLTYQQFLGLEHSLSQPSTRNYFLTEMLFSAKNYESLVDNAAKAKSVLKSRCAAGQLKFDVDLSDYVPGAAPMSHPCDI